MASTPDSTTAGQEPAAAAGPARQVGPSALTGRDELTARQRSLLLALVAGGDPPAGIDLGRIQVNATALLRKRSRLVARRHPVLAAALGAGLWPAFLDYARARQGPPPGCSAADAREFARYLVSPAGEAHTAPGVRRAARAIARPARWHLPGRRPADRG